MSKKTPKKSKSQQPKLATPARRVRNVSIPLAKTQVVTMDRAIPKPKSVVLRDQLIMTMVGSNAFLVNNGFGAEGYLRLNPSNPTLFPTIAYEAANYDMYRFRKLRIFYRNLASPPTAGKVAFVWDPDSQDPPPTSRVDIPQYRRSVNTSVYEPCSLNIPTDNSWRFVGDSAVADRKLIDLGQLFLATYACSSDAEIGDVYIECDVEFKDPQPTATLVQTGVLDVGGGLNSTGPFYISQSRITLTTTNAEILLSIPGTYLLTAIVTCTASGTVSVGGNSTSNGPSRGGYGSGNYFSSVVLTSTGVPSALNSWRFVGATGITRLQFTITRCKSANQYLPG